MASSPGIQALESMVRRAPQDPSVLRSLGNAYLEAGELSKAAATLRAALALEPDNVGALNNLGRSLYLAGDLPAAEQAFRNAITLDPEYAFAHLNLGLQLVAVGDSVHALPLLDRCVALRPDLAKAWVTRAYALLELNRPADALAGCDRAIALAPRLADAHYFRGRALHDLDHLVEALACCDRALALNPTYENVHSLRGKLLVDTGDTAGAVAQFQLAQRTNPANHAMRWAATMAILPALPDDASEVDASRSAFGAALTALEGEVGAWDRDGGTQTVGAMQPFYLAYQPFNNLDLMSRYGRICTGLMSDWQRARGLNPRARAPHSRQRVGIVSGLFRAHAVYAAITQGWMASLDPEKFEVCVFHLGELADAHTALARSRAQYFEQGMRPFAAWAEAIVAREIDVLIYPEIGMTRVALQLASLRLAPTQCVAWGHPQTSGLPTMDYYLSAQAFEPPAAPTHYSEKLIRLPNLGSFYEPLNLGSDPAPAVEEPAIAPQPHFICAGTPFKYLPQYDAVLIEIAKRLGRCQFEFFTYRDGALNRRLMRRLERAFLASGLDPTQFLRLSPRAAPAQFHCLLRRADVMLDTIGFSGFNTVMQALECDLPVVAWRGEYMRGRFGSGILEHIGIRELVVDNAADYVEVAVRLVRNGDFAAAMRSQIRIRREVLYRDKDVIVGLESFLLSQA